MIDEIRRLYLVTSGVAELTRNRAEKIVKELVKAGDVGRDQAASLVKDLVERSKQNRAELLRVVRAEIRTQIASVGVATSRDVERLERRVTRLEAAAKTARKSARKKTTARKKKDADKKSTTSAEQKPTSEPSGEQ